MMNPSNSKFKIVILGDSTVGKTVVFKQFKQKEVLTEDASATLGVDYYVKTQIVDGREIKLELWDTAGQERFRALTPTYYRNADCIILVYDLSSRKTFESLNQWNKDIRQNIQHLSNVYRVLVGNKRDKTRAVQREEGEQLAAANEFDMFTETSAKESEDVECLFNDIGQALARRSRVNSISGESTTISDEPTQQWGCCG